jgi:hypothetical protein
MYWHHNTFEVPTNKKICDGQLVSKGAITFCFISKQTGFPIKQHIEFVCQQTTKSVGCPTDTHSSHHVLFFLPTKYMPAKPTGCVCQTDVNRKPTKNNTS